MIIKNVHTYSNIFKIQLHVLTDRSEMMNMHLPMELEFHYEVFSRTDARIFITRETSDR
jgi:hypothetical protein